MSGDYLVPHGCGEAEYIEKKSRFIGRVWRTDTEEEALARLRETREGHRDAAHNVYAYIIRENNISRYSDDGEPSGTSGQPTLNVFASEGVQNVCCVITRYFGGTLLGAGGLVRAYSKTAKMALDAAGVARIDSWREFVISCDYNMYERVKILLGDFEAVAQNTDFGADVVIEALLLSSAADEFETKLADLSKGKALCERGEERFLAVKL